MNVLWALLCDGSSIDRDSNRITIFNVLEEVQVGLTPPQEPGQTAIIPMKYQMVTQFARSHEQTAERSIIRLRIVGPDNDELASNEFEVDLSRHLRLRHKNNFRQLPVGQTGYYRYVLESRSNSNSWDLMFEVPLRVVLEVEEAN